MRQVFYFFEWFFCIALTDLKIVCSIFYVGKAATKKQKYEKISEKKMSTPVEVLCKVPVHACLHHA